MWWRIKDCTLKKSEGKGINAAYKGNYWWSLNMGTMVSFQFQKLEWCPKAWQAIVRCKKIIRKWWILCVYNLFTCKFFDTQKAVLINVQQFDAFVDKCVSVKPSSQSMP